MLAVVSVLHYKFMQHAFVAGTLVAIGAGIMGYFMVLRSQTFAGHSLANVGFAGATGAAWLGAPTVWGLFIAGAAAAAAMHALGSSERPRVSDVATGAVFTASLALGFLFVHLETSQNSLNIYNVLFGNVLGISNSDVRTVALTILPVVAIMAIAVRPLLFASIDAEAARARGVPVRWLSFGFLVLLAMVVAVAVQIVGVLLIFSLLVTPAATARYVTSRPWRAIAVAVALTVAFTWLGLIVGYYSAYPVSFFITTFAFGTYVCVRVGRTLAREGWRI